MKGQISIDYIIAIVVFIVFVVYFLFEMINVVPNFLSMSEEQRMRLEAYQLSELLVNDVGDPSDSTLWTGSISSVNRLGLSSPDAGKKNVLDLLKVSRMDTYCSTKYEDVRSKIESDLEFSVLIRRIDLSVIILDCKPPSFNQRGFNVTVSRPVLFTRPPAGSDIVGPGELIVQVWKP